jgi:hypothetical protein
MANKSGEETSIFSVAATANGLLLDACRHSQSSQSSAAVSQRHKVVTNQTIVQYCTVLYQTKSERSLTTAQFRHQIIRHDDDRRPKTVILTAVHTGSLP